MSFMNLKIFPQSRQVRNVELLQGHVGHPRDMILGKKGFLDLSLHIPAWLSAGFSRFMVFSG